MQAVSVDGVIQQRQKRIARQNAQRMVELKRRLGALLVGFCVLDCVQHGRELVKLGLRGALDHQLHAQALVRAAHLYERAHLIVAHDTAVIIQQRRKRIERAGLAVIADVHALARHDLHEAHLLQLDQAGRDHRPAHAHARAQLPRRRQLVARHQFPGNDHALDLMNKLIRERDRLDLVKSHRSTPKMYLVLPSAFRFEFIIILTDCQAQMSA